MAGGNNHHLHHHSKPASSKPSSSSRKSHWESENNNNKNEAPAYRNLPAAGNPINLPPPPPPPSINSKTSSNNPPPQQSVPNPSHSGPPFPFPDHHGPPPPPAYGFHMLDRRSIALADGTVRSYFALPPDYQDFAPPHGFPSHEFNGQGFPMSPEFRDMRNRNHDYWNSGGHENSLKRRFRDEGEQVRRDEREEMDGFDRHRQQLLQYENSGSNPNAENSRREDDTRAVKRTRGEEVDRNVSHNKITEVDQGELKQAFLHFVKLVNENAVLKKRYLADGKQGPLKCVACRRSTKDFPDAHALIMHTHKPDSNELLVVVDHLGLHKALCIVMGWNYQIPPDNSKQYQLLSAEEAAANQDDMIMWPPHVIIHNTMTGKGKDGHSEGLGNRAMDTKLRDLGFSSGKSKSLYGREGHLGVTLVKFSGDQSGLKEAMRLGEYFKKDNHGRRSWADLQKSGSIKTADDNPKLVKVDNNTGEKERVLYGYVATISDFDTIDLETKKRVVIASKREYNPV